MHEAVTSKLAF